MRELTAQQLLVRRLTKSRLLEPAPRGALVDVARAGPLIQAQVLSEAEIAIALRVKDATALDVRRELYERRTLVKTWSIRGTLHLVPSDELPLWTAAVKGPEPYWKSGEWLASNGLTARRAAALFDAIGDALDGECLTRAELAEAVEARLNRSYEKLLSGWGELLGPPALMGLLCFGRPRGSNVTFVRADQWIGGWHKVEPAEARREVLRRYLAANGPATLADFRRWSGFESEGARRAVNELGDELEQVRVGARRALMLAGEPDPTDEHPRVLRLLPRYDVYIIGFRPRDLLLPAPVHERVRQDPKGRFESVTGMAPLIVDGIVSGFWRRRKTRTGMNIDVESVLPLPRGRTREMNAAIDRVKQILAAGDQ